MDFGKAFSFPFEDPDWAKKILIPALISLIPILGQIYVIGWALGVTRRVIRHDPTPLPELDFGQQFMDGLKAFVIGLVYALPIILVSIPLAIATGMASSGNVDQETAGTLIAIVSVCCYGIIFIYSLLMAFVIPAAYARMVAEENLGAAFRFNDVFGLVRTAPGPYLMVLLGSILTGIIAGLGTILCVIGVVLTYTYAMAVNGHLYGQAYNEATANRGFARSY
jgi:hypothetical protein